MMLDVSLEAICLTEKIGSDRVLVIGRGCNNQNILYACPGRGGVLQWSWI